MSAVPASSSSDDPDALAFLRAVARAPPIDPEPEGDLSGATLGRYRLLRAIGQGGMGIVYSAHDPLLGREVALKVLPSRLVGDPARRLRLLREARSIAAAKSPHIVTAYDAGEEGGRVFLAMERAPGRTLRAALDEARARDPAGGLAIAEVVRIGREIARGLADAHEAGVIHRDLKPENVMVSDGGAVKIVDFGLASLRGDGEGEGQVAGTRGYMAPEQVRGAPADARSDVFSLGVVLFELATGERPHDGDATRAAGWEKTARPSSLSPRVPAAFDRVVLRCLAPRIEDRYASCRALADDLDRLTAAPSGDRPPRGAREGLRRARALVLAIAAAAGLVADARATAMPAPPAIARPASPLAAPDAALACPPLAASGVEEPSGWLGAAAASVACRRARALLGGEASRAIAPAALLDLPHEPRDAFPRDPFGEPGARDRAVAASVARAAAHLDGGVAATRDGFHVDLVLRDRAGAELGRGAGEAPELYQAVRAAMRPLLASGAIPRAERVSERVAAWRGVSDAGLLVALEDFHLSYLAGAGAAEERAAIEPRRAELGPIWSTVVTAAAEVLIEPYGLIPAPPLDRSSPAAFARSAPIHAALAPDALARSLADEMSELAAREPSPLGKQRLAIAEADLRVRAGDAARARALLLAALSEDPRDPAWDLLTGSSYARPGFGATGRAYAAWLPEAPDAWNVSSYADGDKTPAARLALMGRAYVVAPGFPLFSANYGRMLLLAGEREGARAVAARLAAGGAAQRVSGELLASEIELSEGRARASLERLRRTLFALPSFGRVEDSEVIVHARAMELAELFGEAAELGEAFTRAFVEPEPPRLYPGRFVPVRIAHACARSRPAAAPRCFARLRELEARSFFREGPAPGTADFVDGAERYARGDLAGAAAAWRRLGGNVALGVRDLVAEVFDRAGDPDAAERLDAAALAAGLFAGITPAHARAAQRAAARGNVAKARELAARVIAGWSAADEPLPAVRRMRALLATLRGAGARPSAAR